MCNSDLMESLKISNTFINFIPDGIPLVVGPGGIVARIGEWNKQRNKLDCFVLSTQVYKGVNVVKQTSFIVSTSKTRVSLLSASRILSTSAMMNNRIVLVGLASSLVNRDWQVETSAVGLVEVAKSAPPSSALYCLPLLTHSLTHSLWCGVVSESCVRRLAFGL